MDLQRICSRIRKNWHLHDEGLAFSRRRSGIRATKNGISELILFLKQTDLGIREYKIVKTLEQYICLLGMSYP